MEMGEAYEKVWWKGKEEKYSITNYNFKNKS